MQSQIIFAVAVLAGVLSSGTPAQACSIRGNHCGYPSWAANAFEGRFGFRGNPAILTDRYEGQPPRNVYRARGNRR